VLLEPGVVDKTWGRHRQPYILTCVVTGAVVALVGVCLRVALHVCEDFTCSAWHRPGRSPHAFGTLNVQRELVKEVKFTLTWVCFCAAFAIPYPTCDVRDRVHGLVCYSKASRSDWMDLTRRRIVVVAHRASANVQHLTANDSAWATQHVGAEACGLENTNASYRRAHDEGHHAPQIELGPTEFLQQEAATCLPGDANASTIKGTPVSTPQVGGNVHGGF